MQKKRAAVVIYPSFSLQEITCLTACLSVWYDWQVEVFAASPEPVKSEDGFFVTAGKTFDAFDAAAYDCLILPGALNPIPALCDMANIAFLQRLAGAEDLIIAAISSAPLLLARAGLLDARRFTSGVFDEILQFFDFVPKGNIARTPVCRDGNVITAIGFAFREFAVAVLRAVGVGCEDNILDPVTREYTEDELTFRMGEADFQEFLAEYRAHRE